MTPCRAVLPILLALSAAPSAARGAERACPPMPAAAALDLPATRAAAREGEPLRVVAFGSSSTAGSGASAPAATYPAALERLLRRALPGRDVQVTNRGIGGEDAAEMLDRLDRDVLAARPHLVIWQAGGNGALQGRDPARFRQRLQAGIARLRAIGADIVLMDNQRAPRIMAAPSAPQFEAAMASLSESERVGLFRRGRLMDQWTAAGVPAQALVGDDGLHHTDRGYACLAEALAESIVTALAPTAPAQTLLSARR